MEMHIYHYEIETSLDD